MSWALAAEAFMGNPGRALLPGLALGFGIQSPARLFRELICSSGSGEPLATVIGSGLRNVASMPKSVDRMGRGTVGTLGIKSALSAARNGLANRVGYCGFISYTLFAR